MQMNKIETNKIYAMNPYNGMSAELGTRSMIAVRVLETKVESTKTVYRRNSYRGSEVSVKMVRVVRVDEAGNVLQRRVVGEKTIVNFMEGTEPEETLVDVEPQLAEARKLLGTWDEHVAIRDRVANDEASFEASATELESLLEARGVKYSHIARHTRDNASQYRGTITLSMSDLRKLLS